jgi:hypothetical protein
MNGHSTDTTKELSAAQKSVLHELVCFATFSRIEISTGTGLNGAALDKVLQSLERRGLVSLASNDEYILTQDGIKAVMT